MKFLLFVSVILIISSCAHTVSVKEYNDYSFQLAHQGLYKEAEFYLLKAEKRDPENGRIKNNLAIVYEALGNKEKAEKYYKEAVALDKKKSIQKNYENFKADSSK